jgi:PKHD-type hydroxylase
MKLDHWYWYFTNALSTKFCEELLHYGQQQEDKMALTGNLTDPNNLTQKQVKNLKKKRDSNIVWINAWWVYKHILPFVDEANKQAGWNFNWSYSETCQFTKYEPGQFYEWHQDSFEKIYNTPNNPNTHNKIRKLSVACLLSDPNTYKGGELEFYQGDPERNNKKSTIKCTQMSQQGSIVVFPSFMWHRVCPVTEGTRYSLVVWNLGEKFK